MKHLYQSAAAFTLCLLASLAAIPPSLEAGTITVISAADSGAGTLRAALATAANGDTIGFSLPTSAAITLTSGELLITRNVTITGPAAVGFASSDFFNRVFHIKANTTVTISSLTITGAGSGITGSGIYNDGATLTLSNCVIRNCLGGGIDNDASTGNANLTIVNCTVSGNSSQFGGGIYNYTPSGSAKLTLVNSTISGNSSQFGGGIVNLSQGGTAALTILSSTISSNSAQFAGGIWNVAQGGSASAAILNSTVSDNSAAYAGGVWNEAEGAGSSAHLQIVNSTFSGNSASASVGGIWNYFDTGGSATANIGSTILDSAGLGSNLANEPGATFTSAGYNLSSDDGSGVLTDATDQTNTDPMLGPLQDNGGPTLTHAFICRSPAIDHGKNFSGSPTDQRGDGFARIFDAPAASIASGGDGTDVGAFEAQGPMPTCDLPPVADASATPLIVIAPKTGKAKVILDGSRSSDPDNDPLTFNWSESGNNLASGVVALTVLPVGTHMISLEVSDGTYSGTNGLIIEVITAAEAVIRLEATLNSKVSHSQSLTALLRAALAAIERCNPVSAVNQLQAFQTKVRAQVKPHDAALAASLIQSAQEIIDSLSDSNTNPGNHPHWKCTGLTRQRNGHVRMKFSTDAPGTYLIEASTNLITWTMIGVVASPSDEPFDFEDTQAAGHSSRYYRLRLK